MKLILIIIIILIFGAKNINIPRAGMYILMYIKAKIVPFVLYCFDNENENYYQNLLGG